MYSAESSTTSVTKQWSFLKMQCSMTKYYTKTNTLKKLQILKYLLKLFQPWILELILTKIISGSWNRTRTVLKYYACTKKNTAALVCE